MSTTPSPISIMLRVRAGATPHAEEGITLYANEMPPLWLALGAASHAPTLELPNDPGAAVAYLSTLIDCATKLRGIAEAYLSPTLTA